MQNDATLISHCNNGINLNEDSMKTIGDRIEQLLRDFGRARHEGAAPYTQVELTEMLTGARPGPNGKYYKVSTNKSTINRILTDKQEPPHDLLFALCDMFDTDTEWILRGNVLEPEKIPDRFMTDEANEVGAMIDQMSPSTRQMMIAAARAAMQLEIELMESQKEIARLLEENISLLENSDRQIARDYIRRIVGAKYTGNG